jgi:hypothetical protein
LHDALFAALQTVAKTAEDGLPFIASWGGIIGLALSVLSLAAVLIGYGRWLEKLNGVGKRVKTLEDKAIASEQEREQFHDEIKDILATQKNILERMGEHGRGTEACREDTEKLGIELGAKVHEQTMAVNAMDKNLSNRLTAVETILKERKLAT